MTLARRALFCLLALAPSAYAQSPAAESLFREGRALIKQGKLQDGCDKLEASELIEPSVGTLLNIGDCRERLGKIATAWAAFRKAEAMAKQSGKEPKRESEARKRAQRLEPQLPTLTIAVAKPMAGLVIKRNGEKIDTAVLGTEVPVDPGNYRLVAEAPGYKPWTLDISLPIRGKRQITIPTLEREAPPPVAVAPSNRTIDITPAPRAEPPVQVVYRPVPPVRHLHESSWTTAREAAVGVGAVGALAFGVGAYYGLHSSDLEGRANKVCPGTMCGDPVGLTLNHQAQDSATRANVAFVLGGAAVATATVLWIVGAPDSHHEIRPAIGPDGVGATFSGRF
ncbi:MAG: tetratricopeptide repeat protein [Deltaproteobacteria bacterium]|nr:tetratricopeptide repeat protein [Deltaproteobacteria bacterium]